MKDANSINFSWAAAGKANAYLFTLYMYQRNGLQKVYEQRVFTPSHTFTQLNRLDRGRFAWEVQSLLVEGGAVRSTSKPARRDFTILLPELKKATIITPQVIYAE
jgi:hypothetical protein